MATTKDNTSSEIKKSPIVKSSISMITMTVMIITTIVSLRGLPSQAEFGLTSIFYYIFAAVVFLIPYSLVCAELASTYTQSGGLFRWVSEAFGPRFGWAAMYLEWQTVVIWFPSVLMFASVSLAYIFWPESFDQKLASNKLYTIIVLLGIYWFSTFNTFRGIKSANKLSTIGGFMGTIVPGAILIILGIVYLLLGKPIELPLHQPFFPDFSKLGTVVLAASIFLFYGGMEMQGVHIQNMKNPAKDFPLSVLLATIAILIIFIFATLSIGIVVPQKDINLLQSLLVAYRDLWSALGIPWLGNIMAGLITFGVIGQVSVIIAGPSTGLMAVAKSGYLPRSLQKTNKNGIDTSILYIQAIFVTILTFVLVILPSVQSAYQIMSQMATIIYLVMVIFIFGAALKLRYTEPNKKRGFKIPGGMLGIWIVSVIGIGGALFALILSFIPPSQITTGSPATYIGVLSVGSIIFVALPFVVYALRKKDWRNPASKFYPFDYEIEGRKPSEKSKWPEGYVPSQTQIEAAIEKEKEN
ncbi:MAG: amino acid permease [Bacteroidales bacterium]|nr:amino acid permease [Bacteroidales bacterium]